MLQYPIRTEDPDALLLVEDGTEATVALVSSLRTLLDHGDDDDDETIATATTNHLEWIEAADPTRAVVERKIGMMGAMLRDETRNGAFERALSLAIRDAAAAAGNDDVVRVLDLGAGTGLLSMMATRIDPRVRCVAVEQNPVLARVCASVVAENNLAARVDVIAARSTETTANDLFDGSPADVLVSETLDSVLTNEGMVGTVDDARRRGLVKPGAKYVPSNASVWAQLVRIVDAPALLELLYPPTTLTIGKFGSSVLDVRLERRDNDVTNSELARPALVHARTLLRCGTIVPCATPPRRLFEVDLSDVSASALETTVQEITEGFSDATPSSGHAVLCWWTVRLYGTEEISTSPFGDPSTFQNHWFNALYPIGPSDDNASFELARNDLAGWMSFRAPDRGDNESHGILPSSIKRGRRVADDFADEITLNLAAVWPGRDKVCRVSHWFREFVCEWTSANRLPLPSAIAVVDVSHGSLLAWWIASKGGRVTSIQRDETSAVVCGALLKQATSKPLPVDVTFVRNSAAVPVGELLIVALPESYPAAGDWELDALLILLSECRALLRRAPSPNHRLDGLQCVWPAAAIVKCQAVSLLDLADPAGGPAEVAGFAHDGFYGALRHEGDGTFHLLRHAVALCGYDGELLSNTAVDLARIDFAACTMEFFSPVRIELGRSVVHGRYAGSIALCFWVAWRVGEHHWFEPRNPGTALGAGIEPITVEIRFVPPELVGGAVEVLVRLDATRGNRIEIDVRATQTNP